MFIPELTVSVIVTTYSSSLEKTLLTLESILLQNIGSYEIIITDDGSEVDNFEKLDSFFKDRNFKRYTLIKQPNNIGTVKNLLSAVSIATGYYVKPIGPGDLLYSPNTLSEVTAYMESLNSKFSFGLLSSYKQSIKSSVDYSEFKAPRNIAPYEDYSPTKIGRSMFVGNDWISGSTMFYQKQYLQSMLVEISPHVKYCEDLVQALVLLRGDKIDFYPGEVIWYEYGTGISTGGSISTRLLLDHQKMFKYLKSHFPETELLADYHRIENIKTFNIPMIFKKAWLKLYRVYKLCGISSKAYPDNRLSNSDDGFLSKVSVKKFMEKIKTC